MIRTTYTVHIRSFASRSDNELFVYLLNKSDREQNIKLDLGNKKMASVSEASELAAKGPDDTEPAFRRKDLTGTEIVKMSETSITVIQCQVK